MRERAIKDLWDYIRIHMLVVMGKEREPTVDHHSAPSDSASIPFPS